jgi:hypothetical protein
VESELKEAFPWCSTFSIQYEQAEAEGETELLKEEEAEEWTLIVDDEERLDDELPVLDVAGVMDEDDEPVELVDPELRDDDGFETDLLDEALLVVLLSVAM